MQPKTIVIPFDRHNFLGNQKAIWSLTYSKFIYYYQVFTIVATILFVFDIIIQGDRSFFGVLVVGGYLFYCLMKWAEYLEKRFKFMKQCKIIAKRYEAELFTSSYTFSEDLVEYRDVEKYYQFKWSVFQPYTIYKDVIFLSQKNVERVVIGFGKKQLSEEDFNEVRTILDNKIGFKKARK